MTCVLKNYHELCPLIFIIKVKHFIQPSQNKFYSKIKNADLEFHHSAGEDVLNFIDFDDGL